jgi:2-keto-4-pentenoate hydratase
VRRQPQRQAGREEDGVEVVILLFVALMADMHPKAISAAATLLWRHWNDSTQLSELPQAWRPTTRAEGYAIQAAIAALSGQPIVGWKIAATSIAGQQHIGVDGPLAGRLFADRVVTPGATVSLAGNHLRLAEAEFGFRLGTDLPDRDRPYTVDEVLDAVVSVHPMIELPDSRFEQVAGAGAPQLIADVACAWWLIAGEPAAIDWRRIDLSRQEVRTMLNGEASATGIGANVLGDPRIALTWIANELRMHGEGLRASQIVTTGTCIVPVPLSPGDFFQANFGPLGEITCSVRL